MSRAQKIRDYLVAHPKGVTLRELIAAVEPACPASAMSAAMCSLIDRKKVSARLVRRVRKYFPTPTIAVDGRATIRTTQKHQSQAPPADGATTKSRKQRGITVPPATVPVAAAFEPVRRLGTHTGVGAKEQERVGLAADVAAFIAAGGVIQKLQHGEGSQTLFGYHQPRNDAARNEPAAATPAYGRGNEIPAHRRRASRAA